MIFSLSAIRIHGVTMIHRNNLARLFSRPGDLLNSMGGAVTHAYFQSQHIHLHHQIKMNPATNCNIASTSTSGTGTNGSVSPGVRNLHSTCTCLLGTNESGKNSNGDHERQARHQQVNLDPELKAKLEDLKYRLAYNAYFEKYKEKFNRLEMTSPRELLAKLEQLDKRSQNPPPASSVLKSTSAYSQTKTQTLQEVMAVDLLTDLGREDVIYLWQEFHRKKEGLLAAVMSGSVFEKMADLASVYKTFVIPLPRDHGYEFFLLSYMDNAFHFTPLIAYQTHKDNAPECLRLINYTDLQSSKDLVLMRGEYDKVLLTPRDAHVIAAQTNFYYGETSDSRRKLLETFSSNPDAFEYMDLIEEFKKLQESHPYLFEFDDNN